MTQKERQERSRREIFQAAMEEFGAYDYGQVTMESICTRHGISKGMMYHYYSGKDELFLLCVEDTFRVLEAYVRQEAGAPADDDAFRAIRTYFTLRERFFENDPRRKRIFENAVLLPPVHLSERIDQLRRPLREMNRRFLGEMVARMPLRPGVERAAAVRYLEGMESVFWSLAASCPPGEERPDLHASLESAESLLDMVLFGVVRQP